jgi:hypothetical protein
VKNTKVTKLFSDIVDFSEPKIGNPFKIRV